jgi:hypothetical protein
VYCIWDCELSASLWGVFRIVIWKLDCRGFGLGKFWIGKILNCNNFGLGKFLFAGVFDWKNFELQRKLRFAKFCTAKKLQVENYGCNYFDLQTLGCKSF